MNQNNIDLTDPESILRMPEFQLGSISLVSDNNCEIVYRNRTIKTAGPRQTVVFKYMPKVLGHYMSEDSFFYVTDEQGVTWTPILTEDGWRRKRAW
jgi:hypothetical protein